MPSSKLRIISQRIDKVLLEFFDVLDKYYKCQVMLQENLKSGNLHMSRARYIRGVTSISSLKITEREMLASSLVECSGEDLDTVFTHMSNVNRDDAETPISDTLRKRNVAKSGNDDNNSNNDDERQEKTSDDTKSNDKDTKKKKKQKSISNDPLNWFGVLVPQSLRYSQKNYKTAIEVCVELVNLQLTMKKLHMFYQELLEEKNVLALTEMGVR